MDEKGFREIENKYGCGYWNVCDDRGCPCAITTENKGYDKDLYIKWQKQCEEDSKCWEEKLYEYDDDYDDIYYFDEDEDDDYYDYREEDMYDM